jgi:hypothetical protein
MPNGHGANPRFLGFILLLIVAAALLAQVKKGAPEWAAYPGYLLVAWAAERFAWHLHLWKAMEYDGAYTSGEKMWQARKKYWAGAVIYALAGATVWYFLVTPA